MPCRPLTLPGLEREPTARRRMSDRSTRGDNSATFRIRPPGLDAIEERGKKRDLLAEQQEGWAADRPVPAELLLARWPVDPHADADAASILVAEFFERRA